MKIAIRYGAEGLEVYHPTHTKEDTAKYLQLAKSKNLYITGGSDWHGKNSDAERTFTMTGLAHGDYEILKLRNSH